MAKQSVLTRSKKVKAETCIGNRQWAEAQALYKTICQMDRLDADAWTRLGYVHRRLGEFRESESCGRHALMVNPGHAAANQVVGAALQCQGLFAEAISHYQRAVQLKPDYAEAHYFLGNALREKGEMQEAVASYRAAIGLHPDYVEALSNMGAALILAGENMEAHSVLNRALALMPNSPQILCNLGSILQQDGRLAEALEKYERALHFSPDSLDALANYAALKEKAFRHADAREALDRGLKLAPDDPLLMLVSARLARHEGKVQEAVSILNRLVAQNLSPAIAGDTHFLLGQLLDRLGDARAAFTHLKEGNRVTAMATMKSSSAYESYLRKLDLVESYMTKTLPQVVSACQLDSINTPVFLFGFPRSGTTLLEQVLDSHPALQSMEERGAVQAMEQTFLEISKDRNHALAELTEEEVLLLRKIYFEEMAKYVKRKPGTILIDKMPLHTVHAPLIWRVFPKAKFILAIRHPCDVCFSCFMQNFTANEAMTSFLTLDNAVHVYARVMGLWQTYLKTLPFAYHRVRYEDLVADVEGETRRLLTFLDVSWSDEVLNHTEHARKKGTVNSASYHQVTQPIYQHAKYRWKRYAEEFAPLLETLQPFIDYYGYGEGKQGKF